MENNKPSEKVTTLDGFVSRLYNHLNEQDNLIGQIESKCHDILNKRKVLPETCCNETGVVKPDRDISDRFSRELDRLLSYNKNLQEILLHLQEII